MTERTYPKIFITRGLVVVFSFVVFTIIGVDILEDQVFPIASLES